MGTNNNDGFTPTGSNTPPGGSMAEQAQKDRLYAESAAKSAQWSRDFIDASKPHDSGASWNAPRGGGQSGGASGGGKSGGGGVTSRAQPPSLLARLVRDMFDFSSKPKPRSGVVGGPKPVAANKPWNATAGVIGFLVVTLMVGSRMTGENKWILAAAIGLVGGAIVGRVWKAMVLIGVVGGGLWLWGKSNRNSGTTPTFSTSTPSSSSDNASSWAGSSSTYAPVQIGVAKPDYVPLETSVSPAVQVQQQVIPYSKPEPAFPPESDIVLGGAANAFFNPTEAVAWARSFAGVYTISIKHARELDYSHIKLLRYDTNARQAFIDDGSGPFWLGLDVPEEDHEVWSKAWTVTFYKVNLDGTRRDEDPFRSFMLER